MTDASPLELADRALGFADGEAQATVVRERSLLSRFAVSRPTQATEVDDLTVSMLRVHDGHTGSADTNATTDEALRDVAARAGAAARAAAAAAAAPGDYPGLPAPAPARPHDGFDPVTARLDPARRRQRAAHRLRALRGGRAAGLRDLDRGRGRHRHRLVDRRAGDRRADRRVHEGHRPPRERSLGLGGGRRHRDRRAGPGARWRRARPPRSHARSRWTSRPASTRSSSSPTPSARCWTSSAAWPSTAWPTPRAAARSVGRLGQRVAAANINLADSPRFARTLPRAIDAEGVPKRPLPLIQDGVAHAVVHDTRSAARAGATSTGHALAPGGSAYGPAPVNLVLSGGGAADEAELMAPIERGLYVTRLWYVNAVHQKSTLVTGTTRDGTFLIEDGRLGRPVKDVRFTDSILRLLEATEALTATQRLVAEADFYGRRFATGVVTPALRAQGFRITGQTL